MRVTTRESTHHLGLMLILIVSFTTAYADRTTSYTYNAIGEIETIDGPRLDVNDITVYGYDAQGNRTSITNALNHDTQITEHDGVGRPLTIIDPNGLTTTLRYSPRGHLTQQILSDGVTNRTTDYSYDPVGNLVRVTQPDGSYILYHYDAANRLEGMEDSQGNQIVYQLDAMGNREREEVLDPNGTLTRLQQQVFDGLGRVQELINSENHATEYDYDANGNLTLTIDPNLNPSNQHYDALDRLDEQTDANDGITKYTYDAQDNLTSVTDPNGLTTHYDYDGLGNLLSQTSPDTGTTSYTYDEAGNRLTQTDARGITVSYSYDALNRLTQISYPDASLNISYEYDQGPNGIGRLTRISDAHGAVDYSYNTYGELTSQTRTSNDGIVTTFAYDYDAHGRLASLTYPSGNIVHYAYDAHGQLSGLSLEQSDGSSQPLVSNLQTLPFGPIDALDYGNGLSLSRSFDQDYRLIGQTVNGILQSSYGHDPVGNITDWQDLLDTGRNQQFGYDALDRITAALGRYGSLDYSYDDTGNRLTMTDYSSTETYSYLNGSNQLQQILGSTTDDRTYDEAGNTIDSLIGSYSYDDTNRMVSFSNTQTTASYAYNGKGERIRKTVNGETTRFRYGADGELLGEYDQAGQPIREYVYLDGQPLAQIQSSIGQAPVNFEQTAVLSYGGAGQDVNGTATVQGNSLTLTGNTWKRIAFPYTITPDTVLEFDFESSTEGEIQGIGFDIDSTIDREWSFKVYGSQSWGIQDAGSYTGSGVMRLVIPVGQYFTGTMQWLTFINDHDVASPTAQSRFSNVRVYEASGQAPVDFEQTTVLSYGGAGQDVNGTATVQGNSLTLTGNTWKRIAFPYTITPDTVLEFDFESSAEGEIQGIGFDIDSIIDPAWSFKVYGSQSWGIQDAGSYTGSGVMRLVIPVGQYITGTMQWLTFINDHDVASPTAQSRFSNVRVYEVSGATDTFGEIVYLHTDHLGSVLKATDENQNLVWDVERRPFGGRTVVTEQVKMLLGFPGQYYDQETGNYYNYFRDYDPTSGRYL
ncbi:MAG: RHS repeat-associated core domain-containing protein, partial [Candidatus Thiodiazotropha sp.]